MTVKKLIEQLQALAEEHGDHVHVGVNESSFDPYATQSVLGVHYEQAPVDEDGEVCGDDYLIIEV